jgi:hypothetical protein
MRVFSHVVVMAIVASVSSAAEFSPKPIPRMQVVPLPHHEFSFERAGQEIARYHYRPEDKRPFLFPIIGPSGHPLTRMGHPQDPFTHSHHNSFWISHRDVNGINYWEDGGRGQIRFVRVEEFTDGDNACSATVLHSWSDTNKVILFEHRRTTAVSLPKNEWLLLLDMKFEANGAPVTFGKTSFGLAAVRMAKSIGVNDGGGLIRNSEGGVNEPGVHWKKARWVDYSGAVAEKTIEGITFMDHPLNPGHPSVFHVRNDGWMGAALTFDAPLTVETNRPLVLRYGFLMHSGLPKPAALDARWESFSKTAVADFPKTRR